MALRIGKGVQPTMSTDRTDPTASPSMTHQGTLDSRILGILCDRGELHVLEVADEIGEHPVTVERACRRLHRDGTLRSVSVGVFRCPDAPNSR